LSKEDQIFLLVAQAVKPLPAISFEFWDLEEDPKDALKADIQALPDHHALILCDNGDSV
jgi:hypothetical protein